MGSVSLVPIFATPFAVVNIPEAAASNPALAALIARSATPERRDPQFLEDPFCYRSREDLFEWQEEALVRVLAPALSGLCDAVQQASAQSPEEFSRLGMQARGRFAIVRPRGAIPAASAPMASWCAVYCVAAPGPSASRADSATLRLYGIRSSSMFMDAANHRMCDPFSLTHQSWRPVPGQMAVFPASMLHEVALNHADSDLILLLMRVRFALPGQAGVPSW